MNVQIFFCQRQFWMNTRNIQTSVLSDRHKRTLNLSYVSFCHVKDDSRSKCIAQIDGKENDSSTRHIADPVRTARTDPIWELVVSPVPRSSVLIFVLTIVGKVCVKWDSRGNFEARWRAKSTSDPRRPQRYERGATNCFLFDGGGVSMGPSSNWRKLM